mmetsp:Transcript_148487/g.259528  ORF Transcript_148487/g.259528 Transcript_148487/m.259528 type:complete len:120 (-) Transcript_148487:523-882(-)
MPPTCPDTGPSPDPYSLCPSPYPHGHAHTCLQLSDFIMALRHGGSCTPCSGLYTAALATSLARCTDVPWSPASTNAHVTTAPPSSGPFSQCPLFVVTGKPSCILARLTTSLPCPSFCPY